MNFKKLDTGEETKKLLIQHMGNVHLLVHEVTDIYFAKMRR